MNYRRVTSIPEFIGLLIRVAIGSIAFGAWQQSTAAGIFAAMLLITLDTHQ